MRTKNIILGSLIVLILIAIYGYNKALKLKAIFEKMQIMPIAIRNLKISLTDIRFITDVIMKNPTADDFDINGIFVKLKRMNFFYNNVYMATTKNEITDISIPAHNELRINNISVVLPTTTILQNIMTITNFDINKLSVEAVVEIAGREIYIKQG